MVLPLGENKGGGKLGGHSSTDLCICIHTSKRQVISLCGSPNISFLKLYEELLSLLW